MYRADTIVACATAPGRGAIAIVRWSGRDCLAVAARVFRPRGGAVLRPRRMTLGTALSADGVTAVDEALAVWFPAPHSATGEDTFEVHCHGSPLLVEEIVASALAAGARAAERGEFTRRAVMNGKLDLLQAEAVADLVDARMTAGARAAWQQLQGALSEDLDRLRGALLSVLAHLEAEVDFTDDELPDPDHDARAAELAEVDARVRALLAGYAASRRRREGIRVVFAGRPNAGKSSLVNRLLGSGRMIVSDEPGTTRDVVEETIDLRGIAFVLADTAGIRETDSGAEASAVERARGEVEAADLRVLVIDGSVALGDEDRALWMELRGPQTVVALNKADLGQAVAPPDLEALGEGSGAVLAISARSGEGCDDLKRTLAALARASVEGEPGGISRVRHRAALEALLEPLGRARALLVNGGSPELVAEELRGALRELGSLTGVLDREEVLDRIFGEFCIGK